MYAYVYEYQVRTYYEQKNSAPFAYTILTVDSPLSTSPILIKWP